MSRFISYLNAKRMISKSYIYHLVRVTDSSLESTFLASISVVFEFPEDLPRVRAKREIDIEIHLL